MKHLLTVLALQKSTVTGSSLLLASVLLLKVLSPPHIDAECQLQPAGQLIWADYIPHCPSLVVPACHAKVTNMGFDQNLGARQEFTVFHCFQNSLYLCT